MVLLDGMNLVSALQDLQKAGDLPWFTVILQTQYVTRYDGPPIAERNVRKRSPLVEKLTNILCRESLFVTRLKSLMDSSDSFKKELGVPFHTAQMVNTI